MMKTIKDFSQILHNFGILLVGIAAIGTLIKANEYVVVVKEQLNKIEMIENRVATVQTDLEQNLCFQDSDKHFNPYRNKSLEKQKLPEMQMKIPDNIENLKK